MSQNYKKLFEQFVRFGFDSEDNRGAGYDEMQKYTVDHDNLPVNVFTYKYELTSPVVYTVSNSANMLNPFQSKLYKLPDYNLSAPAEEHSVYYVPDSRLPETDTFVSRSIAFSADRHYFFDKGGDPVAMILNCIQDYCINIKNDPETENIVRKDTAGVARFVNEYTGDPVFVVVQQLVQARDSIEEYE